MNSFPVNIEDYFARVLNIKMCMRKIFYPILLLALIACKGQQQTADSESVADPATESVNPEMGKNNGQSDADATAQPEVDAITSATSRPNQVSFNGRIVLPPQRQATVALTIGGVIKNTSLLPGQHVTKNSVIATLENPEFITLQQTYLDSHAQTEYLRMEYERQKNLSAEQAASQKKFQQSKADYLSMKSRQDAAAAQLSLLGVNPETLLRDGIQPLLEVKAPISGYVVNVAMNMGKYINPGEALCEVIDKSAPMLCLTTYEKRPCRYANRQSRTIPCQRHGYTNVQRHGHLHRTKSGRSEPLTRSIRFHQGDESAVPTGDVRHGTYPKTIICRAATAIHHA